MERHVRLDRLLDERELVRAAPGTFGRWAEGSVPAVPLRGELELSVPWGRSPALWCGAIGVLGARAPALPGEFRPGASGTPA
jgi:hypothetical protein